MPNFTTPVPPKLSGNPTSDVEALKRWGTGLVDELSYLFNNLDTKNVTEAASVKAENINTNNAKISNAQIGALTADKLKAGSVDTSKVTVSDDTGKLNISGSEISIRDSERERFLAAYDKMNNVFRFVLYNKDGKPTVSIDSAGDANFGGTVEGSAIYSSKIVGTTKEEYQNKTGGVFAEINPKGIKVMQDSGGSRKQKVGLSVADDGTAYLILGAGDGSGKVVINDVEYTNGSFMVEKNDVFTNMGVVGGKAFLAFYDDGRLSLSGKNILVNNTDIESEIKSIKQRLGRLETV